MTSGGEEEYDQIHSTMETLLPAWEDIKEVFTVNIKEWLSGTLQLCEWFGDLYESKDEGLHMFVQATAVEELKRTPSSVFFEKTVT